MRWLIPLALLPVLAHADGIIMCKSAAAVADGDALGKCPIADRPCVTSITPGTLVRTHVDPNQTHIWRKWQSLADNGPVRGCATWTTKSVLAPQITVTGSTVPPVTPPVAIRIPTDVGVGTRIGWTGSAEAISYRLYRKKASAADWDAAIPATVPHVFLTDLAPDTDYVFAVSAIGATSIETAKSEPYAYKTAKAVLPKVWTCTTPVATQVGEVTQMSYSCK